MPANLDPVSAPYGSYSFDITCAERMTAYTRDPILEKGHILSGSATISVWLYKYSVEKAYMGPDFDLKRVMKVIYAAGDCSVPIIGRVFDHENRIVSYLMPIESVVKSAFPNPNRDSLKEITFTSKEERLTFIHQLIALVDRLHSRKIIHGDIKTQNLLMCSDSQLRFCDFDDARFEDEDYVRLTSCSAPYASWRRCAFHSEPPTYAEDRYAMGMVIYEIYTGVLPLGDGLDFKKPTNETLSHAQYVLYERTELGLWPDLTLVDDLTVADLIRGCLEGCPPPLATPRRLPEFVCIETVTGFRDCRADPIHAYSQVFHCANCAIHFSKTGSSCNTKLDRPSAPDLSVSPRCPHCNDGVSWTFL